MIKPSKLDRFKVSQDELKKLGNEFSAEALPLLNKLHTASFWILLNKNLTKKIIQQTFFEAVEYCHVTKNNADWQSWILRIWMREIHEHYASRENNNFTIFDFIDHAEITPGTNISSIIKLLTNENVLIEKLERLPAVLRIPMMMKETLPFNYEKIAELIDVPTGVIETRIYRARKLLFLLCQNTFSYEEEKAKWETKQSTKKIFEIRKCARFVDEEMKSEERSNFINLFESDKVYQSEIFIQGEMKKVLSNCSEDISVIDKLTSKIKRKAEKKFYRD